ncbi:hypothetical protein [Ardenticatena maritima]|uniref:Uncharacterized protein n=1 Tax=Ardenticatena maritima TaxID=872965 RepID=A0A0P6Y8T5_9CHLR|nr:hypothetical protein [Ardenticatena maritima]KPL88300.1 hypothetical protein SE16_05560 [Ardenticatena maritima]
MNQQPDGLTNRITRTHLIAFGAGVLLMALLFTCLTLFDLVQVGRPAPTPTATQAPEPTRRPTRTPPPRRTRTPIAPSPTPTASATPASAITPTVGASPSPTPQAQATATATRPPTEGGKLVGVWGVPPNDLAEVASYGFDIVFYAAHNPNDAIAYLEAARQEGLKVVLNLLPAEAMVNPDCYAEKGRRACPFDLDAFTAALEAYRGLGLDAYADTFYAHMLMDEPFDPTNWGGTPISAEELRAATQRSYEVLGPIPTAINAGYVPPIIEPGVADIVMSTFYLNKERSFGDVTTYLQDQLANLQPARAGDPDMRYMLLLQAIGGGAFGPFPSPEEMQAKATRACETPGVNGLFWWTWSKPQAIDFASIMRGPEGDAYRAMVANVVAICHAQSK